MNAKDRQQVLEWLGDLATVLEDRSDEHFTRLQAQLVQLAHDHNRLVDQTAAAVDALGAQPRSIHAEHMTLSVNPEPVARRRTVETDDDGRITAITDEAV